MLLMMLVKIPSLYLMRNLINLMLLYHKDSDADVGNNSDKNNLHYFFKFDFSLTMVVTFGVMLCTLNFPINCRNLMQS